MQESPKNHKKIYYRLRRSDPHERLGATLRHFSFGAAVFFVVAAAAIVIHSLYDIQIRDGAQYRQYAAQQLLLDGRPLTPSWSRKGKPRCSIPLEAAAGGSSGRGSTLTRTRP